jgi:hypothetical protein
MHRAAQGTADTLPSILVLPYSCHCLLSAASDAVEDAKVIGLRPKTEPSLRLLEGGIISISLQVLIVASLGDSLGGAMRLLPDLSHRPSGFPKTRRDCNLADIKLIAWCILSVTNARRRSEKKGGCSPELRGDNVSRVAKQRVRQEHWVTAPDIVERENDASDAQCAGWRGGDLHVRRRGKHPLRAGISKGGRIPAEQAFRFATGWDEEKNG